MIDRAAYWGAAACCAYIAVHAFIQPDGVLALLGGGAFGLLAAAALLLGLRAGQGPQDPPDTKRSDKAW